MVRVIIISLLLSGCGVIPSELVGNWTGNVGPYKAAFKFKADGVGLFCFTGTKVNQSEWVRYIDGRIITARNTLITITGLTDNKLDVDVDSLGIESYTFTKNDKLTGASWYCRKTLI